MGSAGAPWRVLRRPLTSTERRSLQRRLQRLLRWHQTLAAWPAVARAPDAVPFITLYAHGRVRGCYGNAAGSPGERLSRAFLLASSDARYGTIAAADRRSLVASVSYAIKPRRFRGEGVVSAFEPGRHGAALVRGGAAIALLLPQVARDSSLDAKSFLEALAHKAKLDRSAWKENDIVLFEAETVGSRDASLSRADSRDGRSLAVAWLSRQIARDGAVCFALDPTTGQRTERGPMYHGRACTLVQALARHGGAAARVAAARARRWLQKEITAALAGRAVGHWPTDPAMIGGTLALALLAGVDVRAELVRFANESPGAAASPWHAAQIALALGRDTPAHIWQVVRDDSTWRSFAPWTLLAACARADGADVVARCEAVLVDAIREHGPHLGGASVTSVPELALTAVAIEALVPLVRSSRRARAAVARGRDFLTRWQLVPPHIPAALDPALALGAFPASPIHSTLRTDITAHALLALPPRR